MTCAQIPSDKDADKWYANQSLFFANFPPGNIFNGLTFVSLNSNGDLISKDILSKLIREFPWFQFMKGLSEGTSGYVTALTQYNSQMNISMMSKPYQAPVNSTEEMGRLYPLENRISRSPCIFATLFQIK